MPKVSVVVPTHNRAHVLVRAIESILNQTFRDFELIIVDDGSTDDTLQVLASYSSAGIKVITLKHNAGACRARNIGIQAAEGEFIAFQDSDDEWLPEKLSVQLNLMEATPSIQRPIGASYTGFISKTEEYCPPHVDEMQVRGNIYPQLLKGNIVGTPTLLIRRNILNEVGLFDETLTWLEDWDIALRIARRYDFQFADEPLVISHWSPGGVNSRKDFRSFYQILSKHLDGFAACCPRIGANQFLLAGDELMKSGYASMGKHALQSAMRLSFNPYVVLAWLGAQLGSDIYRKLRKLSVVFGISEEQGR